MKMKSRYIKSILALTVSAVMSTNTFAASIDFGADGSDSPWTRRMDDVTGLFGESVKGSAVNDANKGGSFSLAAAKTECNT